MGNEISEIIGEDKAGLPVYRALRPLLCRDCGESIAVGSLFSRWPLTAKGMRILPRCRKCVPLDLPEDAPRPPSPLLDKLLANQSDDEPETIARRKKVDEEISKRLSPALARTRRWRQK